MSEIRANAYFTFTGIKIKIQCTADETLESICKKFSNKIYKEMNSLLFLYEEKQVNFELKFRTLYILSIVSLTSSSLL